jgi:hypothetical protein
MTKSTKDDKKIIQFPRKQKNTINMEEPFDPVEYFRKAFKKAGIKYRIMKPPKDSCWGIYNRDD